MTRPVQSRPATTPAAVPARSAPQAAQPRPPAQAQASARPGNLQPRSVRAQERVNHQLRQGIRAIREQGVSAEAAEAEVRRAMAQGAEPSRPSRSSLERLLRSEGHGNTALHYLAMEGTPEMSREIIRDPQSQNLDVNAPSHGLAPGGGSGATPLHLAVECRNGDVLRDLLTVPGADVRRRYFNQGRLTQLGGREAATMNVVQVAELLAPRSTYPLEHRRGMVAALRALVDHGRLNGYDVNCGPLAGEVQAWTPPRHARPVAPAYGAHRADERLPDPGLPAYEDPAPAQPGPSSSSRP